MPAEGIPPCSHDDILRFEEIVLLVRFLQESFDVRKVRLTGGDPLARRSIEDLVAMLAALNVPDLAMTTNAQGLRHMARRLRSVGLRRVNISLDSLDASGFARITRGGSLAQTLDGIDAALAADLWPIKLNTVVIKGTNDHELCDLLLFAMERGCELRFLELMPIGFGARLHEKSFIPSVAVRDVLAAEFDFGPLLPRTPGTTARRYQITHRSGAEGVVGFISPCSETFCSGCTRLRVTSDGHLIGCLARGRGVPVRPLLGVGPDALGAAVRQVFQNKRTDSAFEQLAPMVGIGG